MNVDQNWNVLLWTEGNLTQFGQYNFSGYAGLLLTE